MLSDNLGEKKTVSSKVPKFLHMVFNVIGEHCCVFLSLACALFSSDKTWLFLAMPLGVYLLNRKQTISNEGPHSQ